MTESTADIALSEDELGQARAMLGPLAPASFFHDPEIFELLWTRVLPALSASAPLRIWVPACAGGEEAYSLAMLIEEHLPGRPWQLFASDRDPAAIRRAAQGRFRAEAPGLPAELAARYFEPGAEGLQVKARLRDNMLFAVHDLLQDPPFGRLDLICCRQLLSKLAATDQQRLHQLFARALRPEGWLLLGPREAPPSGFAERERAWGLYQALPAEAEPSGQRLEQELRLASAERDAARAELQATRLALQQARAELQRRSDELATPERQAASLVHESQARLAAIFTSSQEALMLLDRDYRVQAYNPGIEAWTRNCGLPPVTIGVSLLEVFPAPARAEVEAQMQAVLAGETVEVESSYTNAGGESFWYVVTKSPVREADGISGICISAREITARKQAELALDRSHRRLERARDLAHLGYWDLDPASGTLSCSEQVCAIFELPRQPAYRFEDLMARVHPEDRAALQDAWEAAVRAESALNLTHRLLLPGQRQRLVRQLARLGADGLLEGTVQDLSAWYETEQELASFFDMTPDLLCRVSTDGRLTKLNQSWEQVLGLPREELLARPFFDFIHPDDLAASRAIFAEMLRGVAVTAFENRYRCADGSWRWFSWTSTGLTPSGIIYSSARDVTESKRAAEAIRQSESNLQAIFENVHDSLLLLDRDFRIVAFNEKAAEWALLQEQPPLQCGSSLIDAAPLQRRARFAAQLGQVLAGESFEYETRYQNSQGRETWYLVSLSPVHAPGGVSGICVSGRDITERKQAELTLSQLNERLQKAKDVARLGYWDYDIASGTLLCSPKSCRILGLDPTAELRFEDLLKVVHPDDHERLSQAWAQAISGAAPLQLVHRLLLPEGGVRHVRQLAQLGGEAQTSLTGTVQDISEWYRTEQELSQLFELSTDLICICDFDGGFRKLNPAFAAVLGYQAAELLSQSFLDLVHPQDLPLVRKEFQKLRRGQGSLQVETRARCGDGEERWIAWKATALADTGLVYCSGRDISERRQAEAQLAAYADRLTLILESITDAFVTLDSEGRFTYANQAAVRLLQEEHLVGHSLWALFPASEGPLFADRYRWALIYQEPVHFEVHNMRLGAWLEVSVYPSEENFSVFFRDISEIKLSRSVTELERETLARYAAGREPLPDLLAEMLRAVEGLLPGALCLVQVPSSDRSRFEILAAPNLSPGARALAGQPIAAGYGGCAAAAQQRKVVLVPEMQADPHWQALPAEIAAAGLRAAWSFPVLSPEQELLATFACFFAAPHRSRLPETLLGERVAKLLAVILENQHSNAALQEINQRYELIARATNDVVWDWNLRDQSVSWNQALGSVFGYAEPGADADWWKERIHPDDRARVLTSIHAHIEQGLLPNWQQEYRFLRGDGSYCQVYDRGYLIFDAQGQAQRMLGAMQDITELKRAEAQMRASEAHLLRSQRIARVGSWEVALDQAESLEAAPVTWSEECYRIFGYEPGAVIPSVGLVFAATHPEDLPALQAAVGHSLATGELYSIEHRIRRADGREALIHQRAELVYDAQGLPVRVVGTVRSVLGHGPD